MSYTSGAALQAAVFDLLSGDAALGALLDGGIHDAPVPGTPSGSHVFLGPEDVIDRSDASGPGSEHRFTVSIVSDAPGFRRAKEIAARIGAILPEAPLALSEGRLVGLWFDRAQARRIEGGAVRRIDLRFRARIEG
ncbi:MAG: Protein of unknown function (DUF3168) [Rhodobacteraceae bacterium HLUCCA12]|nr:MAG: Protein of unknown function (DUF3168) [Rhodobacteraceae bacterium HLUCCA12]